MKIDTDALKKQVLLHLPDLLFLLVFAKLGARLAKAAEKPCPMWSSFSEAAAPGESRTPWQSLSKRYTKMRYGRLRMICFFSLSVIAPPPGPWS